MFKVRRCISLFMLLLLLLTACQAVPNGEIDQAGSNPSSGSNISSTGSVVPTTQPTVPITTLPADISDGYVFIFQGHQPTIRFESDLSKLVEGHLYYIDLSTQEITPICDETVMTHAEDDFDADFVYYVKASEPTKIYRTKQNDPKVHTVIYESTFGPVNDITISDYAITKQEVLGFVADNKYFVVHDLVTGETSLVMEQYYIEYALFAHGSFDTWNEHDLVLFRGKLNEDDKVRTYEYSRSTGAIQDLDDECC